MINNKGNDSEYVKYKDEIYLKLQRIFKEVDRKKIEYILKLLSKKQDMKDEMNHLSDMLYRYIERNTKQYADWKVNTAENDDSKPINHQFVDKCIDSQAKDILSTIGKHITKYLKYTNLYKVYKVHTGLKRVKQDVPHEELTGDLKKDAKKYLDHYKELSLKGIFLKEKITSNTLIKKLSDILQLFDEKHHEKILKDFEDILGYKVD